MYHVYQVYVLANFNVLKDSMSFAHVTLQSEIKNLCKQIISLRQKKPINKGHKIFQNFWLLDQGHSQKIYLMCLGTFMILMCSSISFLLCIQCLILDKFCYTKQVSMYINVYIYVQFYDYDKASCTNKSQNYDGQAVSFYS